jgi:hypothetical protein
MGRMLDRCELVEVDGQVITTRNLAHAVSAIMQRLGQDQTNVFRHRRSAIARMRLVTVLQSGRES